MKTAVSYRNTAAGCDMELRLFHIDLQRVICVPMEPVFVLVPIVNYLIVTLNKTDAMDQGK